MIHGPYNVKISSYLSNVTRTPSKALNKFENIFLNYLLLKTSVNHWRTAQTAVYLLLSSLSHGISKYIHSELNIRADSTCMC